MTVRRLAEIQPESFAFTPESEAWCAREIAKYPSGRQASAVIALLWIAQKQNGGWLPKPAIEVVAAKLGMMQIRVLEVATFYTMFNLAPVGKYFIQFCGTSPCVLRGADAIKKVLEKRVGKQNHVSADGLFSWLEVECLGACCNAPMVQINDDYYEDLTEENFSKLLDDLAADRPVRPGSQTGRCTSEPSGGLTSLTSLYGKDGLSGPQSLRDAPGERLEQEQNHSVAQPEKTVAAPPPPPVAPVPATAQVSDAHKPVFLKAAREGGPDDLKLIYGVGPKLEEMLHRMGVYHFDQIADWNADNLAWVDQNLGAFKGRAIRDKWVEQAKKLATGWRPNNPAGQKLE